MAYTHFRLLAYEVPTVLVNPQPPGYVSAWDPGNLSRKVTRIPVPEPLSHVAEPREVGAALPDARKGLPEDAYIRMLRLASVVESTRMRIASKPKGPLNVFVVPEFYFRPPTSGRLLYQGDTYPLASSNTIFNALHGMFRDAGFTDWLFVLGTVLWNNDFADRVPAPGAGTPREQVHYSNSAVVVTGGPKGQLFLVEKKIPSRIDGIPKIEYQPGVPVAAGPTNDPGLRPVFQQWKVRKEHVIDANGVTIGVEVCLDHDERVLRDVVEAWGTNEGPPAFPGVQLQILTAGGMTANRASFAMRKGGYLLRNDGAGSGGRASELFHVPEWGYGRPGPAPGVSVVRADRIDPDEFVGLVKTPRSDVRQIPDGLVAPVAEQRVAVYPVRPLPA